MAEIIKLKEIKSNKRTTKSTNIDEYIVSIKKLNKEKEYVENDMKINDIENILIKQYEVPRSIVAMLIDNVNEKVAMEYESKLIKIT